MTIVTSSLLRSQSKHFFNSQTIPISNRIKTASIEKNLCHVASIYFFYEIILVSPYQVLYFGDVFEITRSGSPI